MAFRLIVVAEAGRRFFHLLNNVRRGHLYAVTSDGKAIAVCQVDEAGKLEISARQVLLARLRSQPAVMLGRWTRETLYESER